MGTPVTSDEQDQAAETEGGGGPITQGAATPEEKAEETPGDAPEGNAEAPVHAAPDPDEEPAEGEKLGPGEALDEDELVRQTLALLFASPDPLSPGRLRKLLERPASARVKAVLERLEQELDASPMPLVLRRIAGGWRLLTDPELGDVVLRLRKEPRPDRITAAVLETLSIVAYRQPVTKAEVEAIRGVQAGAILRTLVDRGLIRVTGRASLPGSPLQYGTTREFLERFGLASLKALPRDGELTES